MDITVKKNGRKVIIAGNGGSAAIASHVTVDFTKQSGIRTVNFNEADLITAATSEKEKLIDTSIAVNGLEDIGKISLSFQTIDLDSMRYEMFFLNLKISGMVISQQLQLLKRLKLMRLLRE